MVVRTFLRALIAAVAVSFLPGQEVLIELQPTSGGLEIGGAAPAPKWAQWVRGTPIASGDEAPVCSVFVFYAGNGLLQAEADADYLGELQRRFADRSVRLVAVIDDAKAAIPLGFAACSVVVDDGQATTQAWGIDIGGQNLIVVLDRAGCVMFHGNPGAGLVDAILHVVDGTTDIDKERAASELRSYFAESFDDVEGNEAKPQVDAILAHAPHDGFAWGIAYLIAATKLADAEAASAVRKDAIAALANESRPLAVFADLALRGDPRAPGLANELVLALQMATAAGPRDAVVQLAFLRALVLADKGREVGRHAARAGKLVAPSALHNLEFAEILLQARMPAVHRDLAQLAVQRAESLGAPERCLAAARYLVALRCAEDAAAAKSILDTYVEGVGPRISINNDCWYFMTQLPTMGRYDRFAMALAERMLEERKDMDAFEFDTAAMAMFLGGRPKEAVELQELAIEKGGGTNPTYTERLARYRAAAEAAPR